MREIKIMSFAKINLSIDVTGVLPDGMHRVDMIMQQLSFHDDVTVRWDGKKEKKSGDIDIAVRTNRYYIPVDERNLAHKAARLMIDRFSEKIPGGRIEIDILKKIPVAAGLAGGSGNGAAVLHALNLLWNLKLNLKQLCDISRELGSDVPFCVMGQAAGNFNFPKRIRRSRLAGACARATGTGTELKLLPGIKRSVVIAKPPMGVSTKEVYAGIDTCEIRQRPDNDALEAGLSERNYQLIYENCINVLENYTLREYPQVRELKGYLAEDSAAEKILMSGSGPTVFAVYKSISDAKRACQTLRKRGYEAYWTKTIR